MNFRAITDDELDKLFAVWDHKVNIQCEKNRFPACVIASLSSLSLKVQDHKQTSLQWSLR